MRALIKKYLVITVATVMAVSLIVPSSSAGAVIDCNDPRLSMNDIQFWNPCDDDMECGVGVFSGTLPAETIKKLESDGVKEKAESNKERYEYAEKETGVPWQVLAAIHYREGGMDPNKSIADGSPLSSGVSADGIPISSDPNEDTRLQSIHYLDMASTVYTLDKRALDKWNYDDWANAFLAYNRGYMYKKSNEPYSKSPYVMNYLDDQHMNMRWGYADSYFDGSPLNDLYDSGARDSNVGAMAVAAYLGFGFEGGGMGSGDCSSGGAVQGEIAQTAINLSWPDRTHSINDPKPEYRAAMKDVGLVNSGCGPSGADCGVFVAAVMRASKADPEFPIGTDKIIEYFNGEGKNKYTRINTTSTADLMPGDIFIVPGHIMMYVGDGAGDGGLDNASASCSERIADRGSKIHFNDSLGRGTYQVYRKN